MTINEQTGRYVWTGNNSITEFTYPYYFIESSHLKLFLYTISTDEETELTPGTYTVTPSGGPNPYTSATVTYPLVGAPMTTDEQLIVYRDTPLEQSTDLTNQSSYFLENIEIQLDRHAMMLCDLQDQLTRVPQTYLANPVTNQIRMGAPAGGEFLVWGLPPDDNKIFSSSLVDLSVPNLNADTVDGEHALVTDEPASGLIKHGDWGYTGYALQRTSDRANDFVNSGYYYSTGLADAPGANTYVFQVINSGLGGTLFGITQLAYDLVDPSNVFCRALDSGGVWQPWNQLQFTNHTHVEANITDLDKYTQAQVDAALAAQTHVEADITNLDKYTQAQVDNGLSLKANLTLIGAANGIAELDGAGLVPSAQLPSYVDDVIEVASLPGSGETGKIYVVTTGAVQEEGSIWRWTGSAFIEINTSVASADTAIALATARNISLTGDATGSTSFDGTSDVSITVTVDDSGFVHTTGNESIAGTKIFSGEVQIITGPLTVAGDTVWTTGNDSNLAKLDAVNIFTASRNEFNGEVDMANQQYIRGKDSGGTERDIAVVLSTDITQLGNAILPTSILSSGTFTHNGDTVWTTGNDSGLLHTTGNETLSGNKTLTSDYDLNIGSGEGHVRMAHQSSENRFFIAPYDGGGYVYANGLYYDADNGFWAVGNGTDRILTLADEADFAHVSGIETIGGAKTFSDVIYAESNITLDNSTYLSARESGGTIRTLAVMDGSNQVTIGSPNNALIMYSNVNPEIYVGGWQLFYHGGNTLLQFTEQGAPTAETTSATLTAAEIDARVITVDNGASGTTTLTLPTAAAMDTYFDTVENDYSFEFSVINTSTVAAEDADIATNTGWSLVGNMDIESNDSANARSAARFLARKTGTAAWVLYRIA